MTDKVQKIREEVQRLQDLTMDKNKNFYSEAAEGEYNALCNIEHFIDCLQEEPVSEQKLSNVERTVKNWKEESDLNWKDMSLQEKKDLLASLQKDIEPASDDLEEAALLHLSKHYDTSVIWDEDEKCVVRDFKAGANWQLKRAINWLKSNIDCDIWIKDFIKNMEG